MKDGFFLLLILLEKRNRCGSIDYKKQWKEELQGMRLSVPPHVVLASLLNLGGGGRVYEDIKIPVAFC